MEVASWNTFPVLVVSETGNTIQLSKNSQSHSFETSLKQFLKSSCEIDTLQWLSFFQAFWGQQTILVCGKKMNYLLGRMYLNDTSLTLMCFLIHFLLLIES